MIYDKLEKLSDYIAPVEAKASIAELISDLDSLKTQSGKQEINEHLFYLRFDYQTKPAHEALWEAHRVYQDIHVVLEGSEQVWCSHLQEMSETNEYQQEGDYQLFEGNPAVKINLTPGYFILFNPSDVHKTAVVIDEINSLKKLVIKVRI